MVSLSEACRFIVCLLFLYRVEAFHLPAIGRRSSTGCQESTTNLDVPTSANVQVIPPNGSFRDSSAGEISVVSFNVLAPYYHFLGHPLEEREEMADIDRQQRVPQSLALAKGLNADVLCLQEVEGGQYESLLKDCLASDQDGLTGYDSCLWSGLHGIHQRENDPVGLCVAWRSCKHRLVASDCYRRGMIVQLQELGVEPEKQGATVCIANVHLPAKPSAIEGRLRTTARTVQRMQEMELPVDSSLALDGLALVVGDFNCEPKSPTMQLLMTGSAFHGMLHDRNYKTKISKGAAATMRHRYRFQHVYQNLRQVVAPVTVSLKGRGPGAMDHMLFATHKPSSSARKVASLQSVDLGKRRSRRERATQRSRSPIAVAPLQIEALLATVDQADPERTRLIEEGLPNLQAGFPSDHIPVGALFVPDPAFTPPAKVQIVQSTDLDDASSPKVAKRSGALSTRAVKRRDAFEQSLQIRRRHNALLGVSAEWLLQLGGTEMIRDQPLYRWKWVQGVKTVSKQVRAPDLCCVLGKSLVVVEVTVSARPDSARQEKLRKYQDLAGILRLSTQVKEMGLEVAEPFVVALYDNGDVPDSTRDDIRRIVSLSSSSTTVDADTVCGELQNAVRSQGE